MNSTKAVRDCHVIPTQIERDFITAIERRQQFLAASGARPTRNRQGQTRHWLSVLYTGWWSTRDA